MPRKPREFSTTDVYHVILRGNDKNDIFYEDQDRYVFLNYIDDTKVKFNYNIFSYCLMDNHVHIIIRVKEKFLSKAIQVLAVRYSLYFNKKFNRIGHLFQSRFFSKKVESVNYFISVCKYIHRNPEKAGISKTEEYKWSSFKEYMGKAKHIDSNVLLHYFGNNKEELKNYTLDNDDQNQLYNYSEYEIIYKLRDDDVANIITKKFNLKNASDISHLKKEEKEMILLSLRDLKGTSLMQISRVTKLTQYYIKQIWK